MGRGPVGARATAVHQCGKCGFDGVQGDEGAAFEAAQRRQAMTHQFALEVAQVMVPKRQVLRQIGGTGGVGGLLDVEAPTFDARGRLGRGGVPEVTQGGQQLLAFA